MRLTGSNSGLFTAPGFTVSLAGIKSWQDEAQDQISELADKVEKNTEKEQEKEKRLRKNEEGLREMQDNMKCKNIRIIGYQK